MGNIPAIVKIQRLSAVLKKKEQYADYVQRLEQKGGPCFAWMPNPLPPDMPSRQLQNREMRFSGALFSQALMVRTVEKTVSVAAMAGARHPQMAASGRRYVHQ